MKRNENEYEYEIWNFLDLLEELVMSMSSDWRLEVLRVTISMSNRFNSHNGAVRELVLTKHFSTLFNTFLDALSLSGYGMSRLVIGSRSKSHLEKFQSSKVATMKNYSNSTYRHTELVTGSTRSRHDDILVVVRE